MSQAPRLAVSVIVATHNRGAKLRVTLEALVEQETPPGLGWEVVVVDNGSTDSTREVFRTVAMQVPGRFRYVFEPNVGKSRALNAGLKVARGEIIALTDDDVSPARNWVAMAATVLDTWKVDGAGGPILPQWEVPPPAWVLESRRLLDILAIMDFDKPAMLPVPAHMHHPQIWGGNMVYRRATLMALGGFDTSLGPLGGRRFCGEDCDIVSRVLATGRGMAYDPALTVYHRVPRARLRRAYFRRVMWDMGEGEALVATRLPRGKSLFGVPIRRLIAVAQSAIESALHTLQKRPDAFNDQLDCIRTAGYSWGQHRRAMRERREARSPRPAAPAAARAVRAPR